MHRSLAAVIEALQVSEKQWLVLALRVGCSAQLTLQEVGEELGVTRERARQIQARGVEKIFSRRECLRDAFDVAESGLLSCPPNSGIREINHALPILSRFFASAGWNSAELEHVGKLVLAVRAMTVARANGHLTLAAQWPNLWRLACLLSPPVEEHPPVLRELRHENELARSPTYQEIAIQILREEGHPLHWKHIVRLAEERFADRRRSFSPSGMFNDLRRHKNVFVRTDHGTYGLREWGLDDAEFYADIAEKILTANGRPLSYAVLKRSINERRTISDSSLNMMLNMNPRFYEARSGGFGLRHWLPPRERQSLSTLEWLIEKSSSRRRLALAARHGHKLQDVSDRNSGS